ncbi:GNAT family N-acetyltransferase [Clostridium tagluense]|uniref:GNAT family N-acetyltransferase n=1 Tax=Clostridium tagluense TaxID=360422 RepID=UPI001CF51643|nr:GNAT family N-acetyltransferase [Clostridium tagluense]MCB2299227.1 GNAT family N-acetyltransferase [Clostridium tagluense]
MIDNIYLLDYNISFKDTILKMIRDFFSFHSSLIQTNKELIEEGYVQENETLTDWLQNHLKIIIFNGENIGFVRIAQRGGTVAWLEDIYVMPKYRKRGIGTKAIELSETFVQDVLKAPALCLDVVPRNFEALKLYYKAEYYYIKKRIWYKQTKYKRKIFRI